MVDSALGQSEQTGADGPHEQAADYSQCDARTSDSPTYRRNSTCLPTKAVAALFFYLYVATPLIMSQAAMIPTSRRSSSTTGNKYTVFGVCMIRAAQVRTESSG